MRCRLLGVGTLSILTVGVRTSGVATLAFFAADLMALCSEQYE